MIPKEKKEKKNMEGETNTNTNEGIKILFFPPFDSSGFKLEKVWVKKAEEGDGV